MIKVVIENVVGVNRSDDWIILIEEMLTAFHQINV